MVRKIDKLVQDSRLAPSGDGHAGSSPQCTSPTSGQKWWLAILLGIVFALFVNPATLQCLDYIVRGLGGTPLLYGCGPTLAGVLMLTVLFTGFIRLILW
jgi:hypothetical protein